MCIVYSVVLFSRLFWLCGLGWNCVPLLPLTHSLHSVSLQFIRQHLIRWPSVIHSLHIPPGLSTVGLAATQNLIMEAAVLTEEDAFGSSLNIFKELDSRSQIGQRLSHVSSVTWWHPEKSLTYQAILFLSKKRDLENGQTCFGIPALPSC